MDDEVNVCFDDQFRIRVLDPRVAEQTQALGKECADFAENISKLHDKVSVIADRLEEHAKRIEDQKLRAIGLRISIENEDEARKSRERIMRATISEKRAELDRLNALYTSLERAEAEQRALIEKLSSNNVN